MAGVCLVSACRGGARGGGTTSRLALLIDIGAEERADVGDEQAEPRRSEE